MSSNSSEQVELVVTDVTATIERSDSKRDALVRHLALPARKRDVSVASGDEFYVVTEAVGLHLRDDVWATYESLRRGPFELASTGHGSLTPADAEQVPLAMYGKLTEPRAKPSHEMHCGRCDELLAYVVDGFGWICRTVMRPASVQEIPDGYEACMRMVINFARSDLSRLPKLLAIHEDSSPEGADSAHVVYFHACKTFGEFLPRCACDVYRAWQPKDAIVSRWWFKLPERKLPDDCVFEGMIGSLQRPGRMYLEQLAEMLNIPWQTTSQRAQSFPPAPANAVRQSFICNHFSPGAKPVDDGEVCFVASVKKEKGASAKKRTRKDTKAKKVVPAARKITFDTDSEVDDEDKDD